MEMQRSVTRKLYARSYIVIGININSDQIRGFS